MKPSAVPDYFRRPPPDGRSRESSLRIDREGRLWHDGAPVAHPAMLQAFRSWLQVHPDDGRPILNNGYDWVYLTIEDAAFQVLGIRARDGGVWLELDDGTLEELKEGGIWIGEGEVVYASVKGGQFQSRFTRSAQMALGNLAEVLEDDTLAVRSCGRSIAVERRGTRAEP